MLLKDVWIDAPHRHRGLDRSYLFEVVADDGSAPKSGWGITF